MFQLITELTLAFQAFLISILPVSTYVEGVARQPVTFLPHQISSKNEKTVASLVYKGLFKYNIFGSIEPDLAETWKTSPDGLVYTIKLKKNQRWSDGSPVTSDDLIYTAFNSPNLRDVATDKIDAQTVRYTLPNKYAPFLNLLTTPVMKDQSIDKYDPLMPVTNGKYRIVAVRKQGDLVKEVVLVSTAKEPNFRKIVFKYYPNEEELITGAKLGEVDGFTLDQTVELENFENKKFPLQGVYYALYFNLDNEKLKNKELRQKLEKVIPKAKMVEPYGIPADGPISRNTYTDTKLDFEPYDELFVEDLSLTGQLVITVPNLTQHKELAKSIESIWEEKLNLDVEVKTFDAETFADKVVKLRNYEIMLYGQETSRDPDRYVNWHSTQKNHPGLNLSKFEQVRADRALEEGRNVTEPEERRLHYHEFQKVITEEVPAIFLYHPYQNFYISKYIEGLGEKYTFNVQDKFLDFDSWYRLKTN